MSVSIRRVDIDDITARALGVSTRFGRLIVDPAAFVSKVAMETIAQLA